MLKITNPATGEVIKELKEDTAESIQNKFNQAKTAQRKWANTPIEDRISAIVRFRELLVAKKEELAQLLTSEVGKPISQARGEIQGVLARIDFFTATTPKVMADEIVLKNPSQNLVERISHEPLGVVANISAWNYPYFVGSNVFIPALLTGNAVLYKPSEHSTLTGLAIEQMLHTAGVPQGVFATITGSGSVGAEILKLPINGAFFTGSFPTGQKIAEASARKMIKTQLELGGKDPVYVCEDVNVEQAAAATADGAFYNTGQGCCSIERLYVHHKIYDAFLEAFMKNVNSFVVGNPLDEKTYIGAITRQPHLTYLENQIQDAVQKGAQLLCGGHAKKGPGYFFEPTVLTQVNHSMKVMREETFGPVIGIQKVQDDAEAVALMNDTEYGLTAGIYTLDGDRANRVLSQMNTGSVYWNCCDRVSPNLPWSGRGHSGIGSTLSNYGIQTFLQPKAWHLKG